MQRRVALVSMVVGLCVFVLAFQLRTWHGRGSWTSDPKSKILDRDARLLASPFPPAPRREQRRRRAESH
jgi:hypothetical protein